ncbi:MAG: plastocyanin/azurin family copper-binding protein [Gammaproteobacteria bacterium]
MRDSKLLLIALSTFFMAGCSEDQNDQAKNIVEEATTSVIEKVEDVAEKTTAGMLSEVKDLETPAAAITAEPEVVTTPKEEPASQAPDTEPQTHVIKAAVTQFRPLVVFAQPGDTIVWQNMNGHDTASMNSMIPEGAEGWQSKMGEIFSVTLDKEGAYLYKCTPHASLGMMGAIIVGNSDNLETIKAGVDTSGEPKGMVKRVIRKVEKELSK